MDELTLRPITEAEYGENSEGEYVGYICVGLDRCGVANSGAWIRHHAISDV